MARRGHAVRRAAVLRAGAHLARRSASIEFNARFGDPETQVVLARLRTPLAGLLHAAATGRLAEHPPLRWSDGAAVTVVVAAAGYPASPRAGDPIAGLDAAAASTARRAARRHRRRRAGGSSRRRPGAPVVGTGADLAAARAAAYAAWTGSGWPARTTAPTSPPPRRR